MSSPDNAPPNGGAPPRPPHPATIIQKAPPHAAKVLQPRSGPPAPGALPPHPATVIQKAPPHAAKVMQPAMRPPHAAKEPRAVAPAPCCDACGENAIQTARLEEGGPKKPRWQSGGNKQDKKLRKMKRDQVVVKEQEKAKIKACEEEVGFAETFDVHILNGEDDGLSHTGYHSQSSTDFNAFGQGVITQGPDAHGVYAAWCTMTGKANGKTSTFFPDGWDIDRIHREVAYAYCHRIDIRQLRGRAAVSWAGPAETDGILIGGRGPKNAIETAFPGFNGDFI